MDALEFIRERNRMCEALGENCEKCPAIKDGYCMAFQGTEGIVSIVEKWAKENPRKTRQSVFLEQWPEAKVGEDGVLTLCPYLVSSTHRNKYGSCRTPNTPCSDCCREFWTQKIE